MVPFNHAAKRTRLNPSYVCLNCRLKSDSNKPLIRKHAAAQPLLPKPLLPKRVRNVLAKRKVVKQTPSILQSCTVSEEGPIGALRRSEIQAAREQDTELNHLQHGNSWVRFHGSDKGANSKNLIATRRPELVRSVAGTSKLTNPAAQTSREIRLRKRSWLRLHAASKEGPLPKRITGDNRRSELVHSVAGTPKLSNQAAQASGEIPRREGSRLLRFHSRPDRELLRFSHVKDDVNAFWSYDAKRNSVLAKKDGRGFNVNNLKKEVGVPRAVREAGMKERTWNSEFMGVLDTHWSAAEDNLVAFEENEDVETGGDMGVSKYSPFVPESGDDGYESLPTNVAQGDKNKASKDDCKEASDVHGTAAVSSGPDFAVKENGDVEYQGDTGALKYIPFVSESRYGEYGSLPAKPTQGDATGGNILQRQLSGDHDSDYNIANSISTAETDARETDTDESMLRRQRTEVDDSEHATTNSISTAMMEVLPPATVRKFTPREPNEQDSRHRSFGEFVLQPAKIAINPDVSEQVEESETDVHELPACSTLETRRSRGPGSSTTSPSYTSNLRPGLYAPASHTHNRPRLFHTAARVNQEAAAAATTLDSGELPVVSFPINVKSNKYSRIRQQFRSWQDLNGNPQEGIKPEPIFDIDNSTAGDMLNSMTRLPDTTSSFRQKNVDEDERSGISQFSISDSRDGMASEDTSNVDAFFLNAGDLVELEFTGSERNSVLAVFIRRIPDGNAQFFTMQGRWIFMRERDVMWSIPRWVSKAEIAPLLKHLPAPRSVMELEELKQQSQIEDMSVPRSASGPLIKRLVKFFTETQEIYRKHASVLDDAHGFLAHETDLRYGSLVSAAATLLQMPARELPVTALYAVRTALARAPLAFNVDRSSHRLTGYLQIRSKEQVRIVQYVRGWLRDWQDDIAKRAQLEADGNVFALRRHVTNKRAQHIYSFLHKARKIVLKSREDREVPELRCGNIGPSQKRFSMEDGGEAVRVTTDTQFTEQDLEIVRFLEAWCASGILYNVSSYAGLPPMILQATGLYEKFEMLDQTVGFVFLQELGVLMPYENRVRFNQHLLLPSSQHSKPLQNLMDNLIKMQNDHQFTDSMKGLRKDWRNLPVYCVDDATAQEIDDGVSIEPVEGKEGEHWLHVHVANPTAFFERDHPLAKMARHMGESLYMPERSYMMLPRWATGRHFSLAKERPCLTFSTRVDSTGHVLERQITPGIIRNVFKLTPNEVTILLGERDIIAEKVELTVGGDVPRAKERKSIVGNITEKMVEDLKTLKILSDKVDQIRLARGGVVFDTGESEISVWQNSKGQGLAWDHPYRHGSRTVEGDPVIQLRTSGFSNWFAPKIATGASMIRGMMLLAGETAAIWCSERGIPTVFRGTIPRPDGPDADAFYRDVVGPAVQKTGEIPTYLGIYYFGMLGRTALQTTPIAHRVAGLQQYVKTTSPLRRYGDMIAHWQIEAALREEAKLGRSLTPLDTARNASFLPFSTNVLDTIMLGLRPREQLITRSKLYARNFWMHMLLFRAHHFGECELPFAATAAEHVSTGKPLLRIFLHSPLPELLYVTGIVTMFNFGGLMTHPSRSGLEAPVQGDTWEVELEYVDVYKRCLITRPVRLVDRPVDENLERWKGVVL